MHQKCRLIGRYSSFISAKLKLGLLEVLEAIHLKSALWITYHLLNQARIKYFSIKRLRNKYIRKRQIILVYEYTVNPSLNFITLCH